MNVFLWIVQVVLALAFLAAGLVKVSMPIPRLSKTMVWTGMVAPATVRFVGIVELLGAVGLILPGVTGIAPVFVPLAATGLAVVMVLAAGWHVRHHEMGTIGASIVLFVLSIIVVWGRFGQWAM